MTTTTDVDARGQMAAAELRSAVEGVRVPATPPRAAPRKRVTLAFAALLLVGAVIVAVAARDEAPTTVITGIPAPLRRLVPTYVPDGSTLYRTEPGVPDGLRVTTAVFASTPRQVRGRGELMVNIQTFETGSSTDTEGGIDTSVRGRAARIHEYSIDNDETLRMLTWLEDDHTRVLLSSTTMDDAAILAAAEALQVVDGTVANQVVGNLSLLSRRSSADQRETRTIGIRNRQTQQLVIVNIFRVSASDVADWLPGREVDVEGHKAWMAHQPNGDTENPGHVVTISWLPSPDIRV